MIRRLLLIVLLTFAVALVPGVAEAHSVVTSSEPQTGERLSSAPGVVAIEFSEPLNEKLSRAVVIDPTGRRFTGEARGSREIRVPLSTNAPGIYQVDWTTVSTLDGHTWRGSFQFGVSVSPGAPPLEAGFGPRKDDLLLSIGRWIEALALLVSLGMLLLSRLARGRTDLSWVRPRIAPVLAVALVAGIAVVWGEAMTAAGSASPSAFLSYVTTGLAGLARLVRLVLEALALIVALRGWRVLWVMVLGAIGSLAASGHGAAIQPTWWGITANAVHLVGAGLWAGGILAMVTLRPPGGWRSPSGKALLVRFSPPALTAFAFTVGFGAIEAIQQLGGWGELVRSSYGKVLLIKVVLVALMLPLSFVAWRLRTPHLRLEATLAVGAVAAAAVLAAFPLPPSRLVEEEATRSLAPPATTLPGPGDLTMGDHAGQVLVGLTLHPARPGVNRVQVYLLPLEGEKAAAKLSARLVLGDATVPLATCGDTCRTADAMIHGDEALSVQVDGPKGGVATFHLPTLPVPDGTAVLRRAQRRIHRLGTYRQSESLSSGMVTVSSEYAFRAPDRMTSVVAGGSETVWIGDTRYLRLHPGDPWQVEKGSPSIPVPSFIWDSFAPFVDPRIIGADRVDGQDTTIVSFSGGAKQGLAIWFRLWIDREGLVRKAEMRAIGHFMDDRYYDFDAPIAITAPRR